MRTLTAWAAVGMLALAMLVYPSTNSQAADHSDPGRVSEDRAADIADLYAWIRGGADANADKTLVVIVTFAGNTTPGVDAVWDPNVLYTVHFRTKAADDAPVEKKAMHIRFATPTAPDTRYAVEVTDIPGANGPIQAHVGTNRSVGNIRVYAGINDDPFFFDLAGFFATLADSTLRFTASDTLAGKNAQAIVIELPLSAVGNAEGKVDVWASSSRIAEVQP